MGSMNYLTASCLNQCSPDAVRCHLRSCPRGTLQIFRSLAAYEQGEKSIKLRWA
jgi:hypothetical protein